jgi:hypothetical protein
MRIRRAIIILFVLTLAAAGSILASSGGHALAAVPSTYIHW